MTDAAPRRHLTFRQSDLERAIRVAKAADLTVTGFEITPEGVIRVLTGPTSAPQVLSPAQEWEARNGKRAA